METDHWQAEAVVLGAGAAGLAAASMLQEQGLGTVVVERGQEAGASWVHRYDGLRLNTVRWMSTLPGYRLERDYGRWPAREDWAAYLQRYATRRGLEVRYGTEAWRVDRTADGYRVHVDGDSLTSRVVVVATGHDHTPVIPTWPGSQQWRGQLLHSAEFRDVEPFRGKDVLVVGAGNSGCEIATLLVSSAATVSLAVRTPPLVLRREYLGAPLTALGAVASLLPDRAVDVAGRVLHRATVGDLRQRELPPSPRGLSRMRRTYWSPPVDSGFVDAVRHGTVGLVAAVDRFTPQEVVLTDGARVRPDVVVAATGYRSALEPLVGHLDVLDDTGQPHARHAAPGLFFAGFRYGLTALLPHVEEDARAIASAARDLDAHRPTAGRLRATTAAARAWLPRRAGTRRP